MPRFRKRKKKYVVKQEKKEKTGLDKKKEEEEERKNKFYWIRGTAGIWSVLLGRLVFNLIGWNLLWWLLAFLVGFPWFISFVIMRIPYEKDTWDWKMIMKTGIGAFFFLFMLVGTIVHTLLIMEDPSRLYREIFQEHMQTLFL